MTYATIYLYCIIFSFPMPKTLVFALVLVFFFKKSICMFNKLWLFVLNFLK